MSAFSIATFNANSVRSRGHVIKRWLETRDVDVLCIQETKVQDHQFPASIFEEMGYQVVYRGEKTYNGVAVASREPLESVAFGFDDGEDPVADTRLARFTVRGIPVVNSYVPQGKAIDHPDYQVKQRFFRRLRELFSRRHAADEPLIWLGDMNVAPLEIDVTHPERKGDHVCFHEDIRRIYDEVCAWGFTDILRRHHPGETLFSFWDYRVKNAVDRDIGWRIDHILATAPLAERSVEAYIDRDPRKWEKPSDHTFVTAVFDLPA
ncbi:MAG: exodeoxyribonuclease III [Synergistales bacterium]|nr:exodeoxyribonuclease III [Synergistales bacterium]